MLLLAARTNYKTSFYYLLRYIQQKKNVVFEEELGRKQKQLRRGCVRNSQRSFGKVPLCIT